MHYYLCAIINMLIINMHLSLIHHFCNSVFYSIHPFWLACVWFCVLCMRLADAFHFSNGCFLLPLPFTSISFLCCPCCQSGSTTTQNTKFFQKCVGVFLFLWCYLKVFIFYLCIIPEVQNIIHISKID